MRNLKALPGIIADIDGVLLRGKSIIGRSNEVLRHIRKPLN